MKKLLVLLALCMVFSVVLVACETNPDTDPETTAGATEAPSETDAETTAPGTTETEPESTETEPGTTETEPNTTEPNTTETEPEPEPEPDPVITHLSFDQLYKGNVTADAATNGGLNFFEPGKSTDWDGNAAIDHTVAYITFWGWVGFYAETIGEFGYQIGDAEPVFSADFAWETGADVVGAAAGTGAKSASRMKIAIPVAQLAGGETTVKAVVKDAAGTIETLKEFKVVKTVPYVDKADSAAGFIGWSFDGFYANDKLYFAEDGNAASKLEAQNKIVPVIPGVKYETIGFRGWTSFNQETAAFGYLIAGVDTDIVFGEFLQARPDLAAANIKNGCGFKIDIPTADLGIGAYNVSIYAKLADETLVKLYDITLDILGPAKDTTNTFVTDVNSNEVDTPMGNTDLANMMVLRPGTNGAWSVTEIDGVKYYTMAGIDAITADMNGAYFFKANILSAQNNAGVGFIVRGYNGTVSTDPNVPFALTNFYETDDAGFCGGSGIYAYTTGTKLVIVVKYYDAEKGTRVGNKIYNLPCEGSELIMADDGYNVYIMVDGVTYATIALSGSVAYEDITTTPANGVFATKAVVVLKDGTTETIENTLVAATPNAQIGITCRASKITFSAVEVGGFSAIQVPALEIVIPEPVDPNAPIFAADANALASAAKGGNHIADAVVTDGYVTITTTDGGDPNFSVISGGSALTGRYLAIKYRTTYVGEGGEGEIFAGSVSITGNGDTTRFAYIADGEWHVAIIDLSTISAVNENLLINYVRYDFYTGAKNATIDLESVALFNSEEAANLYYGLAAPSEPEVIVIDPRTLPEGSITGHMPVVVNAQNQPGHYPMIQAAGLTDGVMIHQGSIYLGEYNLAEYSKIVIYYATDWGEGTQAGLADAKANGYGCLGISAYDCNNVVNPDRAGFVCSEYTPAGGWVITAHEIALGVEYNGPVYVSADFLSGQFIIIDRVELVK